MGKIRYLLIFFLLIIFHAQAQDPLRFKRQVDSILESHTMNWDSERETIIFVGSSSIFFWKDLQDRFPNEQILNCGFGGSHASDLDFYLQDLVLQYNPKKVFIYEGDNDIFHRKRVKKIIATLEGIIQRITLKNSAEIVLISSKPSISRWNLRGRYKRLNKKLKLLAENDPHISYVDVWDVMIQNKKLKEDIFVEDGLHLNEKGYDLWYEAVKTHMK